MGYSIGKELIALPLSDDGFQLSKSERGDRIYHHDSNSAAIDLLPNCHNRRLAVEMDRWRPTAGNRISLV